MLHILMHQVLRGCAENEDLENKHRAKTEDIPCEKKINAVNPMTPGVPH